MLSYQHAYHAGNPADLHKHIVFAELLTLLMKKDRGITVMETHSGRALYDLDSAEAKKTGEAAEGIEQIAISPATPYGRALHTIRAIHGENAYPGSPLIAAPLMPTATLALTLMAIGTLVGQASQGVILAAIQDVTPNQLRGQVTAVTILIVNLLGTGLGASVIAAITDFGFGDQGALRYSIAITGAVALPIIIGLILMAMPHYRRAIAELETN